MLMMGKFDSEQVRFMAINNKEYCQLEAKEVNQELAKIHELILEAVGYPSRPPAKKLIVRNLNFEAEVDLTKPSVVALKGTKNNDWEKEKVCLNYFIDDSGNPVLETGSVEDLNRPKNSVFISRICDPDIKNDPDHEYYGYVSNTQSIMFHIKEALDPIADPDFSDINLTPLLVNLAVQG